MSPRYAECTTTRSNATSCDFNKAKGRVSSEPATEVQAKELQSFPVRPSLSRRRLFTQVSGGEGVSEPCFTNEQISSGKRPLYLSFGHSDWSRASFLALASESDDGDDALVQEANRQVRHIGSTETAAQEPLEQLRSTSTGGSDCQVPEAASQPSASWVTRRSRPSAITIAKAHNRSAPSPQPKNAVWRRPHFTPGLPTSFNHDKLRSQPIAPSDLSHSFLDFPRALHCDSPVRSAFLIPDAQKKGKRSRERVGQLPAAPVLVPSPAFPLSAPNHHHWPSYATELINPQPWSSSIETLYSNLGNPVHRAPLSDISHSRCPSLTSSVQTHLTSAAGSCHPTPLPSPPGTERSGVNTGQPSAMGLGGKRGYTNIRFDTDPRSNRSQSPPLGSGSRPSRQRSAGLSGKQGQPQACAQTSCNHHPSPAKFTQPVTTELIYSPHYLEPYNSCEAIMLPRPRLRSRSLGNTPAFVVERVHAAPERFWRHDTENGRTSAVHLVPMSETTPSSYQGRCRAQTQAECTKPVSSSSRDARLVLHESIPPPLPPKEPAHPSSGLLPIKPLPPTPSFITTRDEEARLSADSIEQLEAPELLALNRQIEDERTAWREQYHTSLDASLGQLRERLSPCFKGLTETESVESKRQMQPRASALDEAQVAHTSSMLHRFWDGACRQETFEVVRETSNSPYNSLHTTVSSPDLGGSQAAGAQCLPLVRDVATRFSSLGRTSRAHGLSEHAIKSHQRPSSANHSNSTDKNKIPVASSGAFRAPLGRGRMLVSDEPVIIGMPIKHVESNGMGMVSTTTETQPSRTPGKVEPLNEAAICTARRVQVSGYRPGGSQEDIKAQLGEHQGLPVRQRSASHRSTDGLQEVGGDRRGWSGSCTNTILNGQLVMPNSLPDPTRSEVGRAAQSGHLMHDASTRRSDPQSAFQLSGGEHSQSRSRTTKTSTGTAGHTDPLSDQRLQRRDPLPVPSGSTEQVAKRHDFDIGELVSLSEQSKTSDSTASSQTHSNPTLWDASSVNIDNLFFRPPPSEQTNL